MTEKLLLDDRVRLAKREGLREVECTEEEIKELQERSGFNLDKKVFGGVTLIAQ